MSEQKSKKPVGSHSMQGIRAEMEVPVNLERVLIEAGKDREFYLALMADRVRALAERGFSLRASEQAILSAMPRADLDKMIEQLRPDKLKKSRFAKQVVTAVAGSIIISTAACGSGDESTSEQGAPRGAGPDWPVDAAFDSGTGGTGGQPYYTGGTGGGGTGGTGGQPYYTGGTGGGGAWSDWPLDAGRDSGDDSGAKSSNGEK